jgi:hypothetical protein
MQDNEFNSSKMLVVCHTTTSKLYVLTNTRPQGHEPITNMRKGKYDQIDQFNHIYIEILKSSVHTVVSSYCCANPKKRERGQCGCGNADTWFQSKEPSVEDLRKKCIYVYIIHFMPLLQYSLLYRGL